MHQRDTTGRVGRPPVLGDGAGGDERLQVRLPRAFVARLRTAAGAGNVSAFVRRAIERAVAAVERRRNR